MTVLLVKDYLKTHTLQQLEDEHGVVGRPNKTNTKISLNYSQILIKDGDLIAEQCRGLIVRPALFLEPFDKNRIVGDVDVLAWPMSRFYNHGQSCEAPINWQDRNLCVYEKLDGTMIVVYWDPLVNKWMAGTRSVSEADVPMTNEDMFLPDGTTFSQLFEETFLNCSSYDQLNKANTYVFELTSPYNRIVVKYDKPSVTLIACRDTQSGIELRVHDDMINGIGTPRTWTISSFEQLISFIESTNPEETEGAVVCDSTFNRVKIKNSLYVLASRTKDMIVNSRREALKAIIDERIDDVLPLVDEAIVKKFNQLRDSFILYVKTTDEIFQQNITLSNGDRKQFALLTTKAKDTWSFPYFQLYDKKAVGVLELFKQLSNQQKLSSSMLDAIIEQCTLHVVM